MPDNWKVGRKFGNTIYLNDKLVGMMDTPELAEEVVTALNVKKLYDKEHEDDHYDPLDSLPIPPNPTWDEGNDSIWGKGNWVWCELSSCLHVGWDGKTRGSYHHKEMHNEPPKQESTEWDYGAGFLTGP